MVLPKPTTMIERLGSNCAIGTDGLQWIVFKTAGKRPADWQGHHWRAVGFIHSSKAALLACLEAKDLKLSPAGKAAIARQDAKIYQWRRQPDHLGKEISR